MNGFACPKLKNRDTGAEIELNINPFSIGRGLSCNYVLQSKTISRVHCFLEKNGDNSWVLNDTSTNGTFVNGRLVRHVRSAPLKDNDTISLDLSGAHRYVFLTEHSNDDISDEQLCAIADTVLSEMEFLASSPVELGENEMLGAAGPPPKRTTPDSAAAAAANPLHDHMYMAKSSNEVTKKARVGRSPRPILGCGNRGGSDSATRSIHDANPSLGTERTGDLPGLDVEEDGARTAQGETGSGEGGRQVAGAPALGVGERRDVPDPERSEDVEERERDEGSRNEEAAAAVGSSQSSGGTLRVGEGELCLPQPGPSTDKDDKPPEQTDNYEVMENELQCVICSELFVKALTLNCSHTFCKYCIQMWNKNKSDCPICRQRITSKTATIVLDNVVEKVIENSNEEIKRRRRSLLDERKRQEEAEGREEERRGAAGGRGGRRGRGRGGRTGRRARGGRPLAAPRINVLDPLSINIGALVNNVIEVSSESEWSSDTESTSPVDTQDDYYRDDWYGGGTYWGGYGYCFRCGSPTHWANNCPNR